MVFKEFLRYASREDIIINSFNDSIDLPNNRNALVREPFTTEELHKIFNPQTYVNPQERRNAAKFWVPLIALYNGCRLNEICQLDVNDVVLNKNIPCFYINHNADDKTTKNESSVRMIPIHPQLLQMGFLHYVEFQRRQKNTKLFELRAVKTGLYTKTVQNWFPRYLEKLGLKTPSKVFHSFRHTFETKAVERKIPTEYQNALCGWRDYGIGQRIYGRKKDIRVMQEELSKISYPLKKEMLQFQSLIETSYMVKW